MEKQVSVSTFYRFMASIYGITLLVFDAAANLAEHYSPTQTTPNYSCPSQI